jgi:two-component system chemotaxis sensor kinase CheA
LSNANIIDKHRQAYQEEAREVLVELESSLLELNERPDDAELVGRVFRSMHTIKGSGAMFGFDEVASFTHHLETAFDEVREGRLAVTSKLVDLSLEAVDLIKRMLDEPDGASGTENAIADGILVRLRELTGITDTKQSETPPSSTLPQHSSKEGLIQDWLIRFAPGPNLMRNGTNPLLLLRELRQLGDARVTASMTGIPPLSELDPERCYVSWEIQLTTTGCREAIRDVFMFVEDCCELTVELIAVESPSPVELTTKAFEEQRRNPGRREHDKPDSASSIRVPAAKLDQFVNLVGELVTVQARLVEIAAGRDDPEVLEVSEEIERLTTALRENSMSIRMLPIRATFERFRRLVHDLARDLHKNVELSIEGADTELDKTVIDQLNDPLMHLIRNSMDHGIESPEARLAAGKPPTATIHLSARHSGANVLIGVTDDGRGIDADAVRARAVQNGLVAAEAQLTEAEVFSFILMPGFSTAKQVTDVSGRGVGMDVVNQRVEALRGRIDIASKFGSGTRVTLRLPLTMAIIDGLLVRVGQDFFVLPLANTLECIELTRQDIEKANGNHVAHIRGEMIPYIRLRDFFDIDTNRPEREQIMIAETEDGRYGFVVDEVLGDHQTVIKSLGRLYRQVQFVSGATILGNGTVALILDPHRLVQEVIKGSVRSPRGHPKSTAAASCGKEGLFSKSP